MNAQLGVDFIDHRARPARALIVHRRLIQLMWLRRRGGIYYQPSDKGTSPKVSSRSNPPGTRP
jgi:hypothetical protein